MLLGWVRRRKTGQAPAPPARIVLACAGPGVTNAAVAAVPGPSLVTAPKGRRAPLGSAATSGCWPSG
jgi:hypothetical protein